MKTLGKVDTSIEGYGLWYRSKILNQKNRYPVRPGNFNILFSVFLEVDEITSSEDILATVNSLIKQSYKNIEIIILIKDAQGLTLAPSLEESCLVLRGCFLLKSLTILDIINGNNIPSWGARGNFYFFSRAGMLFSEDAFLQITQKIISSETSNVDDILILCDSDELTNDNQLSSPKFLPGWDPDLIVQCNYIGNSFGISASFIKKDSDQFSSIHEWLKSLANICSNFHVIHIPYPVLHTPSKFSSNDGLIVNNHYEIPHFELVSIIIPNKNKLDLLKRCLRFLKMGFAFNFEIIIVDNGSADSNLFDFYEILKKEHQAIVLSCPGSFNYSKMVNMGVGAATSPLVIIMNNDVEITGPDQINQLVTHAARDKIGIVGSKLLNYDLTVGHAGMVLSPPAQAGHVMRGALDSEQGGYMGVLKTIRNYQSVTGALMAMKKSVFYQAGGFDEIYLPIEYNDVDFCLKVRQLGYRVICLPLSIFHSEGSSRGVAQDDIKTINMREMAKDIMLERWKREFANDPFKNPNIQIAETSKVALI